MNNKLQKVISLLILFFSVNVLSDCLYDVNNSTYSLSRKLQIRFCKLNGENDKGLTCLYQATSYRQLEDKHRVLLCAGVTDLDKVMKCISENITRLNGKEIACFCGPDRECSGRRERTIFN